LILNEVENTQNDRVNFLRFDNGNRLISHAQDGSISIQNLENYNTIETIRYFEVNQTRDNKESATDWGIWHNNPLNTFDFTRADGATGIATDVGGSTTNVVMIRLSAATGQGTFAGPLYASINQRVFADNYHPNADTLTTARTLTIGSTGKTFNGSANVSWSLAEIGAQPAGSYLITESDTLQTVTTRGGTTDQNITIEDATFSVKTTGVDFDVNNLQVTTGVNSNISGGAKTVIISGTEINFLGLDANNSDSATILKNTFALGAFNNGTGEAVIDMSAKTKVTVTAPTIDINGSLNVSGNLTINGTTTTLNSTTLTVDDNNIELGSVASPTNTTADGGGITLKGATDKTINWVNSTGAWTSNQIFSAPNFVSTVAIGTQPYATTSTTVNTNLNADLVDGLHATSLVQTSGAQTIAGVKTFSGGISITGGNLNLNNLNIISNDGQESFYSKDVKIEINVSLTNTTINNSIDKYVSEMRDTASFSSTPTNKTSIINCNDTKK
jgi:hypothetical protein